MRINSDHDLPREADPAVRLAMSGFIARDDRSGAKRYVALYRRERESWTDAVEEGSWPSEQATLIQRDEPRRNIDHAEHSADSNIESSRAGAALFQQHQSNSDGNLAVQASFRDGWANASELLLACQVIPG